MVPCQKEKNAVYFEDFPQFFKICPTIKYLGATKEKLPRDDNRSYDSKSELYRSYTCIQGEIVRLVTLVCVSSM